MLLLTLDESNINKIWFVSLSLDAGNAKFSFDIGISVRRWVLTCRTKITENVFVIKSV
jgi:hypothetical protein